MICFRGVDIKFIFDEVVQVGFGAGNLIVGKSTWLESKNQKTGLT